MKAVLFDVDGVLLDSVRANAAFYRQVLEHFGYRGPTDEEQRGLNYLSMMEEIRHFAPDADDAKVHSMHAFADTSEAGFDLLEMSAYAADLVRDLAQRYVLAIVTGRTRAGVQEFFQLSGLQECFRVIAAFEDTTEHKPHPAPLLFALEKLGVRPAEAVYIGDAATDVAAANAAHVPVILYAPHSLPGADVVINHLSHVPTAIAQIERSRPDSDLG